MRRLLGSTAVLALALASFLVVQAQTMEKETKTTTTTTTTTKQEAKPAPVGGVKGSILFQIDQAREKLLALANATPDEKYGWRPGEGVRTTGEVFNHVAAANYFLPTFWGAKVPAGVNPQTLEKEMSGDKAKTVDTLARSFESLRAAILAVPEADLSRKIKLFGQDATVRDAMMVLASHAHEHLGQSIAYARSNGIVPPWSK